MSAGIAVSEAQETEQPPNANLCLSALSVKLLSAPCHLSGRCLAIEGHTFRWQHSTFRESLEVQHCLSPFALQGLSQTLADLYQEFGSCDHFQPGHLHEQQNMCQLRESAMVAAGSSISENVKGKTGITYKTFFCWTFASRSSRSGSATCVCIVLHVNLEVCSIINRLDRRFQPDAYLLVDQVFSWDKFVPDEILPSSGETGTRVDPSLRTMLSNKNAYLVR